MYQFQYGVLKGCRCSQLDGNGKPHPLYMMQIAKYGEALKAYHNNYIKINKV